MGEKKKETPIQIQKSKRRHCNNGIVGNTFKKEAGSQMQILLREKWKQIVVLWGKVSNGKKQIVGELC